ncbi:MAG: response regulator transcription factor [Actinobacteria bacterium]|nr:response regulator transcription factor [Actinomycetota bacterium]
MLTTNTTELLADLAKTVLDDPKPDQFLSHIVNKTLASIDARGAILGVIEREGFLDLQGTYGCANDLVDPYMRIPLWTPMPITDAARSGEISIFKSPKEMIAMYPHLSQINETEAGVTISAPIKHRNTVIGAIGFISMKSPSDEFPNTDTTQGVLALCGLYIRNLLANKVVTQKDYSTSMQTLSPRQKQIIKLFKEDLTTDQMAERLKYSSSTIKQDIIKIYSVFGVNSRNVVVQLAEKAGLS